MPLNIDNFRNRNRWILFVLLVGLVVTITACGGGGASSSSGTSGTTTTGTTGTTGASGTGTLVTVSVLPTSVNLVAGLTQQFSASVQGATNVAVTFEVNGVIGGNKTVGTISGTGLYTAPLAPPNPNTVTVSAVSVASASASASAAVTIAPTIAVTIAPATVSLNAGLSQQFTVSVQGTFNVGVSWTATGGTISSSGLFTAPTTPPSAPITVTVSSIVDPSATASATVTITSAPALAIAPAVAVVNVGSTLQLSATINGTNSTAVTWSLSFPVNAGSISPTGVYSPPASISVPEVVEVVATSTVDPQESATAQVLINEPSPADSLLSGRYAFSSIGTIGLDLSAPFDLRAGSFLADGGGSITDCVVDEILQTQPIAGSQSRSGPCIGAYMVGPNNQAVVTLVGTESTLGANFLLIAGTMSGGVAQTAELVMSSTDRGTLVKQPASPVVNGSYVFGSAVGTTGTARTEVLAIAGIFQANAGGIVGSLDENAAIALVDAPMSGTYSFDPTTGRGSAVLNVATVGSFNTTFYVTQEGLLWFGLDPNQNPFSGFAMPQSGTFSNQSLSGASVFSIGLVDDLQSVGAIGLLTADGAGSVTGTADGIVNNDNQAVDDESFSGTYDIAANGVGSLNIFNQTFAIFAYAPNSAFLMELPNNPAVQTGLILPQTGNNFSDASISGTFVSTGGGQGGLFGFFNSSAGTISGSVNLEPGASFSGFSPFEATYSISQNGRGTLVESAPGSETYVLYLTGPNSFIAIPTGLLDPAVSFGP